MDVFTAQYIKMALSRLLSNLVPRQDYFLCCYFEAYRSVLDYVELKDRVIHPAVQREKDLERRLRSLTEQLVSKQVHLASFQDPNTTVQWLYTIGESGLSLVG